MSLRKEFQSELNGTPVSRYNQFYMYIYNFHLFFRFRNIEIYRWNNKNLINIRYFKETQVEYQLIIVYSFTYSFILFLTYY